MTEDRQTRLFVRLVLLIVFLVLFTRLIGFVVKFGNESLQMDLAAYYTAGQSVQAGASPYLNHVDRDPPIWDGVNVFRHSRFLYPPLVASGFELLALAPYYPLKFLWMALTLLALVATLIVAVRLARLRATPGTWLAIGVVTCSYYPVLALLERGQVDAFTLLLILVALVFMRSRTLRSSFTAGVLFSLASLLKLNCIFLLPFLLIRRRWRVAAGFVVGGVALVGLDLVVDGPSQVQAYVFRELPRISEHGEGGTREMSLPRAAFGSTMRDVEPGKTVMDGRSYRPTYFHFVLNGALVQAWPGDLVRRAARAVGRPEPHLSHLALLFLAGFCLLFFFWQRRSGLSSSASWSDDEPAYWLSVLVVVLLCGPVTWAMSTVWLLAVVPVVLREIPRLSGVRHTVAVLCCVVGLLLVGAPDPYGNFMLSPFSQRVLDGKYVLGQLLCLAGLLELWGGAGAQRTDRGSTPVA